MPKVVVEIGRSVRDLRVQTPRVRWRAQRASVRAVTRSDITGAVTGELRFTADQVEEDRGSAEDGGTATRARPRPPTSFTLLFTPSRLGGVGGGGMTAALVVQDDEGETEVLQLRRV